jgi:zinc and cadmium transporter
MIELFYIIIISFAISFIAFVGIFALSIKEKILNQILLLLVALSAGTLIGGAFFHLLPEAIKESGEADIFTFTVIGFVLFFIIEKVLHWHHCYRGMPHKHTFHYMNIIGDTVHNFIDGLVLAASFVVSIPLGFASSIAIAAHEIPQEIGDFGVLVYGGFEKKKSINSKFYNCDINYYWGNFWLFYFSDG